MCRWLAYSGKPVLMDKVLYGPQHSLIEQSLESRMGAEPTNGDGFGIGWYSRYGPGTFKSMEPAWNDRNLRQLAGHVESHLFVAHVRATTIIPLLAAASLVGWTVMIIYSTLAFLIILTFGIISIPPFYTLPPHLLHLIEWMNHLFAYLITVTIIVHLMLENTFYEKILYDKNRLLAADKLKFEYLAHFDQLTNLPNRQLFKQYLQETITSLKSNQCISVFFMDLDNLKYINDAYGHEAGDNLLMQAGRRIKSVFRDKDFVARLGGDEFTAIIIHSQKDNIPELIAKIITQEFEKQFIINTDECYCTISFGLSNYPKDSHTVRELMASADKAMYAAKRNKKELQSK